MYGVPIKFIKVQYINKDDVVFGDYSHLKSDKENIYDMFALPENSESFDTTDYNFSEYGFNLFENLAVFITKKAFDDINLSLEKIVGNLIVFPNNKVQEITNIDWQTPGINNLFTYADQKSVYKLTLVPYQFRLNTELDSKHLINDQTSEVTKFEKEIKTMFTEELPQDFEQDDIKTDEKTYDKLDNYFEEVLKIKTDQKEEAEIKDTAKSATKIENTPIKEREKNKSIIDNTEKNVWNDF